MINYRLGNIELRVSKYRYSVEKKEWEDGLEIVEWGNNSCWSIALFEVDKDGICELHFVQDRPLSGSVDWVDFGNLIEIGYKYLNNLTEKAE